MRRSPKLRPNLWDGVVVLAVAALAVAWAGGVWQGGGSQEPLSHPGLRAYRPYLT